MESAGPLITGLATRRPSSPLLRGAALALPLVAAACGCSAGRSAPTTNGAVSQARATSATTTEKTAAPTTTTVDPGTLAQTRVLPAADDPAFEARVQSLWRAIVDGDPARAMPFFFPRTAYLQIKAVGNVALDYRNRLVAFYALDIEAAHRLLGTDAASAAFESVSVPTAQAVWVLPGEEQNKGPYYRVYGTRITYREHGATKSFGVFSMLSWRGEWYVIHLGPNPRPVNTGMVYQPMG